MWHFDIATHDNIALQLMIATLYYFFVCDIICTVKCLEILLYVSNLFTYVFRGDLDVKASAKWASDFCHTRSDRMCRSNLLLTSSLIYLEENNMIKRTWPYHHTIHMLIRFRCWDIWISFTVFIIWFSVFDQCYIYVCIFLWIKEALHIKEAT